MKKNSKISNLFFAALFSAVISVISQVYILTPFGIPLTLQTFAISLCGFILGTKWGTASVITYIGVGLLGLPVFSGFSGGIQHIISPTGGFIIGFIFLSLLCGILNNSKNKFIGILLGIIGVSVCHLIGVIWFSFISKSGFWTAFITSSMPFLIKDILSVIGAFFIAFKIRKYIQVK